MFISGEVIIYLIFAIPVLALLAFGILFLRYKKRKKEAGADISEAEREKLKNLKTYVLVTGITAAVFVIILIILAALVTMMVVAGM